MGKWCLHASSFIFDIKTRSSSIWGRIGPLIFELLALEWRKIHTFELQYLWSQLANLDKILYVASLGWGKCCIGFWGRLDQNSGFHGNRKPPLTYNGENDVSTFSRLLIRPFWKDHIWPWHIGLRWAIVALWATRLKLATNDRSDKMFLLTLKFCPQGVVRPFPGAIYMYKIMEKQLYKIRLQRDFLKLVANEQSDKRFLLTSKFCPLGLSAPDLQLYTCIKS